MAMRPKAGIDLQNIVGGDQPLPVPTMPDIPTGMPNVPQHNGGFFKEGGMGRYLAGAIGDALLQNAHMAPIFMPMQQRRQEEATWGRRLDAQQAAMRNEKQWEWTNKPQEDDGFTQMIRAAGIDPASEQGKALYAQRVQRQVAEPDVITTLPNGQLYAGPRSGLAAALTGGAAPSGNIPKVADESAYNALPPGAQFYDDQGNLRTKAGGPTQPASGGFPR